MNEPDALDGAGNHSETKMNTKNVHMYMSLSPPNDAAELPLSCFPDSPSENPLLQGCCAASRLVFSFRCGWESRADHLVALQRPRTQKI